MAQNADAFVDVMGLLARGPGPETAAAGAAGAAAPASEWHGVLDDARHRLEPVVVELARRWGVPAGQIVYDMAGIGRSFGSYLASYGLPGATGYFGAGWGGQRYVNRRTANAFALRRRLHPHRDGFIPFYCGGIPEWPNLRQELAELYGPAMDIQESQVKQLLEAKDVRRQ